MKKRRELLRDPNNPEEKDLRYEIEEFRTRMYSAWLFEGKWRPDFKDIASEARLHPKTVEKFVLGLLSTHTSTPSSDSQVHWATASRWLRGTPLINRKSSESVRTLENTFARHLHKSKSAHLAQTRNGPRFFI